MFDLSPGRPFLVAFVRPTDCVVRCSTVKGDRNCGGLWLAVSNVLNVFRISIDIDPYSADLEGQGLRSASAGIVIG